VTEEPGTRFGVLAYGPGGRLHREAAAAILSVQAHRPPATSEIVVLTDQPARYRWFGDSITVDPLSDRVLTEWRGQRGDRYRPKIEALRRLAADAAADVLLFDVDTMARRDLAPLAARLAAGGLVLHRREYALAAPPRRGDRALKEEILGHSWQGIAPDASASMWNGGIIGSSRRHKGIFDRALAVFDEMRDRSRHFAVEQLAYSIVFPAYGTIEEASPWFDHYWANREWFDRAIERFLSDARLKELTAAAAAERLKLEPITGPLDGRLSWWRARLQRLVSHPDGHDD
jgi:hypothetical protein